MVINARVAPKRDTTANWDIHSDFIPLRGELIIYTDYRAVMCEDGNVRYVPGVKIGDGITVVGELPFIIESEGIKAYRYAGSVETIEDLESIENPENGDIYYIEDDDTNCAWNEDTQIWDDIGSVFSISSITEYDLDVITGSASSEEALIEILSNGGNVELATNISLNTPVTLTADTVLDLNGHILSGTLDSAMLTVDGANLTLTGCGSIRNKDMVAYATNGGQITIKKGEYVSSSDAFEASGDGSAIVMDGGSIDSVGTAISASTNATIIVNGGQIDSEDKFGIATKKTTLLGGNTITINGGKIDAHIKSNEYEACAIYIANSDTLVINGGEIVSHNGAGLCMRAGDVTIHGGSIAATGTAGTKGIIGDSTVQMGKSGVIYHESANYPERSGMKLTIDGGEITGVDHAVEILSHEASPNVFISGGEFTPAYPED